jgi:ring-1,2-phenylacetyl-CoA epoxidase subunit PaaE
MATKFYPLTIKKIAKETANAVVISFNIPEALQSLFNFKHGQNIALKTTIDGQEVRRSYSICTAPYQQELSIAIKKVEGGIFSCYANQQLKVGDVLVVLPPTGKFGTPLNATLAKNYIAFAFGSGITPILSIIKNTLFLEPNSSFTLLYSNKNKASIMFFEELEGLKNSYLQRFNLINILSKEKTEADIFYGRINESKLQALNEFLHFKNYDDFFICGPEAIIFCIKDYLSQLQINESQIHFELFGRVAQKLNDPQNLATALNTGVNSKITIKVDGRSIDFTMNQSASTILDEALKNGADLPFACKGGVCCTCKAKLTAGTVQMDVNWGLEKEEIEQGFILTCQAHPTSNEVVVDFDER